LSSRADAGGTGAGIMMTRRGLLWAAASSLVEIGWAATNAARIEPRFAVPRQIKAFCVDFNWLHGKFAPPGHWAGASPQAHVDWYRALRANVIQTFAVSCNGYAWYQGGRVPSQPGLKHNFLPEVVELAHKNGMLAMGYFCAGANSKWGADHPDLSYDTPSTMHIPFTEQYLDYLADSVADAVKKTGMDGTMIDWLWNPADSLRARGWLPAERKLYTRLTGRIFPRSGAPTADEKLDYERRALARCWSRIKAARDGANPDCILWLSVSDLSKLEIRDAPLLQQVDWLMNESPNPELYEMGRRMAGGKTRMIQNEVGWLTHDARRFLSDPQNRKVDLYGFAEPGENSLPLPVDDYLRKPIDDFKGKDHRSANNYNIAALARFYRGIAMNSVLP
jgi:Hypothetical glycosyl hydrolase 6